MFRGTRMQVVVHDLLKAYFSLCTSASMGIFPDVDGDDTALFLECFPDIYRAQFLGDVCENNSKRWP